MTPTLIIRENHDVNLLGSRAPSFQKDGPQSSSKPPLGLQTKLQVGMKGKKKIKIRKKTINGLRAADFKVLTTFYSRVSVINSIATPH